MAEKSEPVTGDSFGASGYALITRAADFAARAHAEQRRKDAARTPYINHLIEVAHLLAEANADENLVAAGYLHDTVEDTLITPAMLEVEFGEDITTLVMAATDDKALSSIERKRRQIEHAPHLTPREANLKLADKISNLRSLAMAPPAGWPPERMVAYIAWAHEVVTRLPGTQGYLLERYWEIRGRLQSL